MIFQSLCSPNDAAQPGMGSIAESLSSAVVQAFSGYVIPHRTEETPTFTDEQCNMYVKKREWLAKYKVPEKTPSENRYEFLLEALFWDTGPFSQIVSSKKLIFVSGTIGSGKSTFVDYYLRCFCPTKSEKGFLFPEKLIIHCDLKNRQTIHNVDIKIWRDIKSSLLRAGIDPSSIYDFDNELRPTQALIMKVLQIISTRIKNRLLNEKAYLVIVIDNIDQSPVVCQTHCLSLVQDLTDSVNEVTVWKIIFPLWPQTLGQLKRGSGLTVKATEYHEVELGNLDLSDFYRKKIDFLTHHYKALDDPKATRIVNEVSWLAAKKYRNILRDLTYGNFLAMDDLIVNLLLSEEIEKHQEHSRALHISDYRFFDSLITGKSRYHSNNTNGIVNPFAWLSSIDHESQIFIMPYLIRYLKITQEHQKEKVREFFRKAGFKSDLINEALDTMSDYHMLHFENDNIINPHRKVLHAYERLISEPAVLDNFAHTTPVPLASMDKDWRETKGYDPKQFYDRCRTTIKFLKSMFLLEVKIESSIPEFGGSVDKFRHDVPAVIGTLRKSYNDRLQYLRSENWPADANITDKQWNDLFR